MAYKHFLRLRRIVHIGGWKLGPLRFGGGEYTVGPLSVLAVLQLLSTLPSVLNFAPNSETEIEKLVAALPPAVVVALLPLFVQQPVKQRHLRRTTSQQALEVFLVMAEVNDWPYIFKALQPSAGEKGVGIEVLLHSIVKQCPADTHRDLLLLPMQEVLAISDAARDLEGTPEEASPLDGEDRDLLTRAGFRVN